MKLYELTYLIAPELSEEEARDFSQKINSLIQNQGGILEKTEKPEKRSLGYPFKKGVKFIETAFVCSLNFYLKAQKLIILEQILQKEENILRFSFFKKRIKKTPAKNQRRKKVHKSKKKKVELKEIEEKIEEILKE